MISFILDHYYLYLRSLLSSLKLVFICFFCFCFMMHLCFFYQEWRCLCFQNLCQDLGMFFFWKESFFFQSVSTVCCTYDFPGCLYAIAAIRSMCTFLFDQYSVLIYPLLSKLAYRVVLQYLSIHILYDVLATISMY
jgi:hypothetical protein